MILKLKRTPGIYLVGYMGCGKTTVGRLLAEELGWDFVDIDDDIEAAARCPITEIFERRGEGEFRAMEAAAIARRVRLIGQGKPMVVALGGGAFAQQRNYVLLTVNGISIWLDCPLEVLWRRVQRETHRPLARDRSSFEQLYEARHEGYGRADFRVETAGEDPRPVVVTILRLPIF